MDGIEAFIPPNVGEDEHIVRRLGWAVVKQRSRLPRDIQERIEKQAWWTEDKEPTIQLSQQIAGFLDKHAGRR